MNKQGNGFQINYIMFNSLEFSELESARKMHTVLSGAGGEFSTCIKYNVKTISLLCEIKIQYIHIHIYVFD
jgi:hypothetical protein